MILKALYDYYHLCDDMPPYGTKGQQIGFIIVLSRDGRFLRFEDCRIDKKDARSFFVKQPPKRTSGKVAYHLFDKLDYVFGLGNNGVDDDSLTCFELFKAKVNDVYAKHPDSDEMKALSGFYDHEQSEILEAVAKDTLWDEIVSSKTKKYAWLSFRLEGEKTIIAENPELINEEKEEQTLNDICLVTGNKCKASRLTPSTPFGGNSGATLVSFQIKSGYDSYGKEQCYNAPISEEAAIAYTTALNTLLNNESHNKFSVGLRTFLFWSSVKSEVSNEVENTVFGLFGGVDKDDPNANVEVARNVFKSIYSGSISTSLQDKFYVLGISPNKNRIVVVYWSETSLKEFAHNILRHFEDMEIDGGNNLRKPYYGLYSMLNAVVGKNQKVKDFTPSLCEEIIKSIFDGTPYPNSLFTACIRRIRSSCDDNIRAGQAAILKAYLNRINDNKNKKITVMLDKENTNPGYLCGRLFAILVLIQEKANNGSTIKERFMEAASATPAAVFANLLRLSIHHEEKLENGLRINFEKTKQEIIEKLNPAEFPSHLSIHDQGRFFVGYYQQRQDFFTSKNNEQSNNN